MPIGDWLRQVKALLPVAIANTRRSLWASLTIIVCTLLVVVVVAAFLSMASGFEATTRAAGSDRVVVVLGMQSTSESNSRITAEQVSLFTELNERAMAEDITHFSPELTFTVGGIGEKDGRRINMPLRGLDEQGRQLRSGFEIIDGRMYQSGGQEIIAGRRLYEEMGAPSMNSTVTLGGRDWTLVGVFSLDSAVFEWDYWTDLASMQSAYGRQNQVQAIRLGIARPELLGQIQEFVDNDPRLAVDLWTERQLYEKQGEGVAKVIRYLGWPLAVILGSGCVAGVLNTMFISMQSRRRSLRTLKVIGYAPAAIIASVVAEGIVLALTGASIGLTLVFVILDGLEASMIGASFMTVEYNMQLTSIDVILSLFVALLIGGFGAIVPAWKAVHS